MEVSTPNATGYEVLGKGQPTGQLDVAAHLHCRQRTYLPLLLRVLAFSGVRTASSCKGPMNSLILIIVSWAPKPYSNYQGPWIWCRHPLVKTIAARGRFSDGRARPRAPWTFAPLNSNWCLRFEAFRGCLIEGSCDAVTRARIQVAILRVIIYNPNPNRGT